MICLKEVPLGKGRIKYTPISSFSNNCASCILSSRSFVYMFMVFSSIYFWYISLRSMNAWSIVSCTSKVWYYQIKIWEIAGQEMCILNSCANDLFCSFFFLKLRRLMQSFKLLFFSDVIHLIIEVTLWPHNI